MDQGTLDISKLIRHVKIIAQKPIHGTSVIDLVGYWFTR
jgi:hypothetical protein